MIFPVAFMLLLGLIRTADVIWDMGMNEYGLYPLKAKGLLGIITAPLLHANFSHLFANTVPLLVLGSLLFYFYRPLAKTHTRAPVISQTRKKTCQARGR